MPRLIPKIYPITDVAMAGMSQAEQVIRLIDGGASLIQLREKNRTTREFYQEAKRALDVGRAHGAKLIINDRVDLALTLHADGVHLGQDDLDPILARKLLGADALIGFSTHSVEQARNAMDLPIDYLAIGPVFSTTTKSNPDPVVGLDGIRQVRAAVPNIPLVAIGGISISRIPEVLAAGADSVALISAILRQPNNISSGIQHVLTI
ncbi:MAG: thiamine phosphate synthase [Blastocatellia bacterium]|nr:MAG: thiamine phosphate synthase [Blastocatellia bacterium]